jgi:hypothetical protein
MIETVRISYPGAPDGYAIINLSDFDESTMELFVDSESPAQSPPEAEGETPEEAESPKKKAGK